VNTEVFKNLVEKKLKLIPQSTFSSTTLVLRPNYLLYFCTKKLDLDEFKKLDDLKASYLSFENTSTIESLLSFLFQIQGGAYLAPQFIADDSFLNFSFLTIALIDPHSLDEITKNPNFKRLGVLIRKKTLAIHDFQIEILLS
jgi:hypothetical protein